MNSITLEQAIKFLETQDTYGPILLGHMSKMSRLLELTFDPAPNLHFAKLNEMISSCLALDPFHVEGQTAREAELESLRYRSVCSYCGTQTQGTDHASSFALVAAHIEQCEKHPMKQIAPLLTAVEMVLRDSKRLRPYDSSDPDVVLADSCQRLRKAYEVLTARHGNNTNT